MANLVIGTVPYLNEKPLTRWFTHTDAGRESGYEVVSAVPSELAGMLARGEIVTALVSSFEYFRTPGYEILPGISISGQDEILSVRAFTRIPWLMAESVAADTSSLTSVALLKILLAEQFDSHPGFLHHAPDLDAMLAVADAALIIGDNGMLAKADVLDILDLGKSWRRLTGLPFVYAVWLARPENITPALIEALQTARAWGETQIDAIAPEEAARLGCPVKLCRRYLEEIMDYDLGGQHIEALELFGRKARAHGLLLNPPMPVTIAQHAVNML